MKKEMVITAVFLALCVLAALNIRALTRLTGDVTALAERAAEKANIGEWGAAEALARDALDRWEDGGGHTKLVLRHADIESAGDALGDLVRETLARSVSGVYGAALRVRARMDFIADIERPGAESIF